MRRYNQYKDSGVEWIGEIPSHWEETRLRFVGDLFGGLTGKSGDDFKQDNNPGNKPYIPYTNIFRNTYISKEHVNYVVIESGENQNKVKKFDLFFLMSSETYQDLGKPCILIDDVDELYLNSFCKGFRVKKEGVYPLFLNYQLLGDVHKELISIEGRGFTRINLRQDRLNDTRILLPPLSEQHQIVSYLDTKTSLIDTLIENTQKKIELLKEKRTSLISEVVTKGLNPNVEMKDSGVEWIGEIPSGWEVKKNKYFTQSQKNKSLKGEEELLSVSEYYGVIPRRNIREGEEHLTRSESLEGYLKVRKGELVSNIMLMWKKGLGVSEFDGIVSPAYSVFSFLNSVPKYFHYLFRTNQYVSEFRKNSTGVIESRLRLYDDSFGSLMSHHPPLSEQEEIVSYLDEQTQLIDKTISVEERRIELLKEYRQSLISEVVTGKRKVTKDE